MTQVSGPHHMNLSMPLLPLPLALPYIAVTDSDVLIIGVQHALSWSVCS